MSRYELRGLMPGVWEVGLVASFIAEACGGGGAAGKGDFEPGAVVGDDDGEGSGVAAVDASRLSLSIFSLYASCIDSIVSKPSLREDISMLFVKSSK